MSRQKDREEFIALAAREGIPLQAAQRLMGYAATLHWLAELACSSEAADKDRVPCPAVKSQKDTDCVCHFGYHELGKHSDVARIDVQKLRTRKHVEALCKTLPRQWCVSRDEKVLYTGDDEGQCWKWLHGNQSSSVHHATTYEGYKIEQVGVTPIFGGDPRGAVLKLRVPSGKANDWGGAGICVPS